MSLPPQGCLTSILLGVPVPRLLAGLATGRAGREVRPIAESGGVATGPGAQALFHRLLLLVLRVEVTLDAGQPRVGLLERVRVKQLGDLSATRQLLRLFEVVAQLVQARARVSCVNRQRTSRGHGLTAVGDVPIRVAAQVAVTADHGRTDEGRHSLPAGRAVHRRRC